MNTWLKQEIGEFNEKNIYLLASKPFIDKTAVCIDVALDLLNKQNKVLYISSSMSKEEFENLLSLENRTADIGNLDFVQLFYLDNRRFRNLISAKNYQFVIIDPSDTLMLDTDIGLLKESAREYGVGILLTRHLSGPSHFSNRTRPSLYDLTFIDKKTKLKYISYIDAIILLYKDVETGDKRFIVPKNMVN